MTTTYPALRGTFGTTVYYAIIMRVSELVGIVEFPSENTGWKNNSLEEMFQRKLNITRVNRNIAPYFASDPKRFSGALVVTVLNPENMKFEIISDIIKNNMVPFAYNRTLDNLGFISLDNTKLITLDGQHRTKALQRAIHWLKNPKECPADITLHAGLEDEQITLILVDSNTAQSRYIFNKINKYAKPTSKAGKLITDDDDAMAVLTRGLIENETIPKRLINIESNSLKKEAIEFTLLSTFHDANKELLSALPVPTMSKPENMKESERVLKQKEIAKEWKQLLKGISEWKSAISDPNKSGDQKRILLREKSLLGRPIGQLALVKGYAHACIACGQSTNRGELIKKLNAINWNIDDEIWKGVLVKPDGKVMYGVRVANMASKLVAHLLGISLSKTENERLLNFIYGTKRHRKRLPPPIILDKKTSKNAK